MVTPPEGLKFPEWKETDGPAPYVWSKMPAGHKCGWSCNWIARVNAGEGAKVFTVREWRGLDIEAMTTAQLCAELNDIAARGAMYDAQPNASQLVQEVDGMDRERWLMLVENLLRAARVMYPEYLAEWNVPPQKAMHMQPKRRPGWSGFQPVAPVEVTPWQEEQPPAQEKVRRLNLRPQGIETINVARKK